mgnify:CR=1 FL=1
MEKSTKSTGKNWLQDKWRPMMGWVYMVTCITDFIVFPVLWAIFQAYLNQEIQPWNPLTLQGAGLYHLAMGAVLGVAAWSRGQEKITAMNRYPDRAFDDNGYPADYQEPYQQTNARMPLIRPPRPSRRPLDDDMPPLD